MGDLFKLEGPLSRIQKGVDGPRSFARENVLVLAKGFSLSESQKELLNRGLTFVPTLDIDKNQKAQLKLDLQNYHRRIKLAMYFKGAEQQEIPRFREASNWMPPPEKLPPEVHLLVEKDNIIFNEHYKPCKEKFNLSREEVKALRELMHNKHIVIKPADKGSMVVILSREQYIQEVERQLNDTVYYRKLTQPIYKQTIPLVTEILDRLKEKKFINAKQRQYLKGSSEPRERRFYTLPKIHKEPEKWTVPFEVPPGRPIVSDCESETYRIAEYLDFYLNPLSTKHPSYVKDTYDFIDMVKKIKIPANSYFFSMDVDALYTNIDIQSGLNSVQKVFKKYPDPNRPDEELLQLLDINLSRNDFVFNEKYYLQIKGTAMGKKFAPAYANIFMANWEEEVFAKCQQKPTHYLRYLDDIWGIWTGSREEFEQFLAILNSHDASIKLKYEISQESITFLDTTVYKRPGFADNNQLDIKVFFKKTDTHALLFKTSFHPAHTFRGIVKSQLLRFRRICTRDDDFMEAVRLLFKALRERGYSRPFLRHCLKTFHIRKERDHKKMIPLITSFSSISRILHDKVKNNFQEIIASQDIIPNSKVISAYRRQKNLCDWLVRAKLKPLQQQKKTLLEGQFSRRTYIQNQKTKTFFKISQHFSPRSSNCVYVIFCSKCGIQYVGETSNSLSTRMVQHRYNIRNKREINTPLVRHYLMHGLESVRMAGLQRNSTWSIVERKKFERKWIYLLNTKEPFGLNIKYN